MLLRVMPRLRLNSPGVCPVQRRKARMAGVGVAEGLGDLHLALLQRRRDVLG
jgi:hypothetical protein